MLFIHCCSSFIVVLNSLMSLYFRATSPCNQHSTLASQPREGLHQLGALLWILSIAFAFSSTAGATVLSEHLLPTSVFDTTPKFLTLPAFIKASLGGVSFFLKFAGLHVDPRNTDPVHLFV